jgi:hypothetical protein
LISAAVVAVLAVWAVLGLLWLVGQVLTWFFDVTRKKP